MVVHGSMHGSGLVRQWCGGLDMVVHGSMHGSGLVRQWCGG